jgi:hypothetical protein
MANTFQEDTNDPGSADLGRATDQLIGRLTALGIALSGDESPDQITQVADAVERFEDAVEARGGDLMIDEPPSGARGQGDVPDFVLPRRAADESLAAYVARLDRATAKVLQY